MAKKTTKVVTGFIKLQITAGEANPAPPVGPALGQKGLNIMEFCKAFNAKTQKDKGTVVPVIITVYKDKSFSFIVKKPPVAVLIKQKIKLEKGSGEPNRKKVGAITKQQIEEIAKLKMPDLNCYNIQSACKLVAGTAKSMGLNTPVEYGT
jgi:large subunit ribosomal protein L11